LPLPHVEQFPRRAENTMGIPLNIKFLELAYRGLKDDIIEISKHQNLIGFSTIMVLFG